MPSKKIRVTEQPCIAECWQKWVRPRITDAPLKEFLSKKAKGLRSELAVINFLRGTGWEILGHDVTCARVQIDILARSPAGVLTIFEVKTQSQQRLARLSLKQYLRLSRAASMLAQCEPVQLCLSTFGPEGIRCLPVDGLTPI